MNEDSGKPRARSMLVLAGLGIQTAPAAFAQIEFGEADFYPLALGVSGVAVADMDGDGWRDVVVCERIESVTVFHNGGNGTLIRLGSLFQPTYEFTDIHAADLDADGHCDLVWIRASAGSGSLHVAYGRGNGGTGRVEIIPLPRLGGSLDVADVTGDGRPDLIVTDARRTAPMVRVFRNVGQSFVPGETAALPWINNVSLVTGDLDGDGDTDLAVLSLDDEFDSMYGWKLNAAQVCILLNDGTGGFPEGRTVTLPYGGGSWGDDLHPVSLRLGDLDGDRDLDLVVVAMPLDNAGGPLDLLPIESMHFGTAFELHAALVIPSARIVAEVAVGDLDSDGDLDLIVKAENELWSVENHGSFELAPPTFTGMGTYGGPSMAMADLDGDGRIDLVEGHRFGMDVMMNVTPYDGPLLELPPLKRGQPATMTVSDAQPGERVYFLYSREGAGNSVGIRQLGGITLDLVDPIQLIGSAVADSNGVAELTITIPPNAPLTTVVMQAVIRRGPGGVDSVKTPFRTARIQAN
ncbi:MAG: VCBS repeat-containing protein [Phycisphaerales bacterium]|nr:VCBS repeat-containing protein [Phycisphaerales bacterium]